MKKLSVLFLSLFAVATITSCSKDDDNSSPSIEGKWEISKHGETLETLEAIVNYRDCGLGTTEYLKGGKITETEFYYDTDTEKCAEDIYPATWTIKDKTLTVTYDADDISVYEIVSLTDSSLTLKVTGEGRRTWFIVYNRKK